MATLDAWQIDKSGSATDERAAGKRKPRDRLQATFVNDARTVSDALTASERGCDCSMPLEPLHLFVRRQVRIAIVEMDDEADRNEVLAPVILERSPARVRVERPALT